MRTSASIRLLLLVFIAVAVFSSTALAQEKRLGLVMGYPPDVGVSWQLTDNLALRGDAGFQWNESETSSHIDIVTIGNVTSTSTVTSRSSTGSVSFGVAGLVTLRNEDNLRLYLGPRVSFRLTHLSVETHTTRTGVPGLSPLDETQQGDNTGHTTQIEGLFGAQYRLAPRFAVFGEGGIGYANSSFPSVSLSLGSNVRQENTGQSFGVRTYGGVILFF